MATNEKNYSEEFNKYMEYIANHPNYKDLPGKYKKDGSIKWVASGNSEIGKARNEWWEQKMKELNVNTKAEVARKLHPEELNGMKPCQTCGKKLNIHYVYPNKNTLKKLNELTDMQFEHATFEISEIFDILYEKMGDDVYTKFEEIFKIIDNIPHKKDEFIEYILKNYKNKFSPGVMSNAPDRLDGFHSYNLCCRSKEDKGRDKSNLSRYTQDRRAYENWADGNWNMANRIMGEFNRYNKEVKCPVCGKKSKMSADHIGPISLGFSHRAKFNPMCQSCNSKKNNRMTYLDIQTLINDEKHGEEVISWHSKTLWDNTKFLVKNDEDALKLSKLMRIHIHNILYLLHLIDKHGFRDFLKEYLNPEYSFKDYTFENFNPLNLNELKINSKPINNKNKQKNSERYVRVAFETLEQYNTKDNRKIKQNLSLYDSKINKLLNTLRNDKYPEAKKLLSEIINDLSYNEIKKYLK